MLFHVDGVLIYLQSFEDFHLTGSIKKFNLVLIHVMTLEGPNDGWQNVMTSEDNSSKLQVGSLVKVDYVCSSEGWGGRWVFSFESNRHFCWVHAEILSCSHWKLKESRSSYGTADLQRYSMPLCFNLMPFSAPQHAASPPSFSKRPLRALLKARSGSEVTLECKPQASPPAISLWKKGSEILQRSER